MKRVKTGARGKKIYLMLWYNYAGVLKKHFVPVIGFWLLKECEPNALVFMMNKFVGDVLFNT